MAWLKEDAGLGYINLETGVRATVVASGGTHYVRVNSVAVKPGYPTEAEAVRVLELLTRGFSPS